ncbi:Ribonucleoside-diphosphate reductase small chain A, partial [Camellia lanceoleosa]
MSDLLETYIRDSREKHRLFNAIENIPCVAQKAKWALDWIQRYYSILILSNFNILLTPHTKHQANTSIFNHWLCNRAIQMQKIKRIVIENIAIPSEYFSRTSNSRSQ